MNRRATLLNQLRKIQTKIERCHDWANAKYGSAHELTQELMFAFALTFASVTDVESMLEDDDHRISMEDE